MSPHSNGGAPLDTRAGVMLSILRTDPLSFLDGAVIVIFEALE